MIQIGTSLQVVDNSGAKQAYCIKILNSSSKKKFASVGDLIIVVIKTLRNKRLKLKVKKGEITLGLIIRTKVSRKNISFSDNSIVLLNKQFKLLGTRIFGPVFKFFRFTKFLKVTLLSSVFI